MQTVTAVIVYWFAFYTFVPVDVFDDVSPWMLVYMFAEYKELIFLSILN